MKTAKRYIESGGDHCPFCGDWDIEGAAITVEAGVACQAMGCNQCDSAWFNYYHLDHIAVEDDVGDLMVFGRDGEL